MRQSRAFWLGFGLLCGACLLSALNPCVGVFALAYLAIALVALVKKATWKPIKHSISVDVAEFSEAAAKKENPEA